MLEHLGLTVNRLIRLAYGPFQLGTLPVGSVEEVGPRVIRELLAEHIRPENLPTGNTVSTPAPIPGRRTSAPIVKGASGSAMSDPSRKPSRVRAAEAAATEGGDTGRRAPKKEGWAKAKPKFEHTKDLQAARAHRAPAEGRGRRRPAQARLQAARGPVHRQTSWDGAARGDPRRRFAWTGQAGFRRHAAQRRRRSSFGRLRGQTGRIAPLGRRLRRQAGRRRSRRSAWSAPGRLIHADRRRQSEGAGHHRPRGPEHPSDLGPGASGYLQRAGARQLGRAAGRRAGHRPVRGLGRAGYEAISRGRPSPCSSRSRTRRAAPSARTPTPGA